LRPTSNQKQYFSSCNQLNLNAVLGRKHVSHDGPRRAPASINDAGHARQRNFDLENSPAGELPLPNPYQRGRPFR
jgi:hypothetical protein